MKILNISYALPSKRVTNQTLIDEIIDRSRKHLPLSELRGLERKIRRFLKMSGTVIRYHRSKGERALDFALEAGRRALKSAGVGPNDVDLLIYAGVGRGWVEPATANLFQSELGLKRATCFDVLDACASWIRSLSIAKSFLDQAMYRLIMVLNCEFSFREYANLEISDVKQLETSFSAFTIGEASTATLLTAEGSSDDSFFSFKTWGDKHGLCKIALPNAADFAPSNGTNHLQPMSFFASPGELMAFTIKKLVGHFKETRSIATQNYDFIVTHAVSVASSLRVLKLLNLDPRRLFETHSRFGNTVSASLPLGMAVAEHEGQLERGMRVLMLMGSAGVTTGLGTVTY
ncbi:MAG: 3-oxoacyl-ACP synthase III family protein [Acidobacteriota bacterium]